MSYTPAQQLMYDEGRRCALELQGRSPEMDGTALVAEEEHIPRFDPQKDYTGWKPGYPVKDEGQVWTLLQPYNAAYYEGRPSMLRALWGLAHTKDPDKAKAWVAPYGTSGMYMADECYQDEKFNVWRCKLDNTVHTAEEYPDAWEFVSSIDDLVIKHSE